MIVKPITNLINLTIECSNFLDNAKNAMVTSLHKKNSNLDKENGRPVSILPVISKIYEMAINEQLCSFLVNISMNTSLLSGQDLDVRAHS